MQTARIQMQRTSDYGLSSCRERSARSRARRRHRIRITYGIIGICTAALILLVSLLIFGLTSRAETQGNQMHKYYTSILVIGDQTLEDIAGQYADPDYYRNTAAYYREICEINHLPVKEGGIPHVAPGNYIIVPYFSPDFL